MSTYSLLRLPVVKMGSTRFLHISHRLAAIDKSNLAKLRKRTGFTIANCKKALETNDNDIQKAETWLHAEAQAQGWAKAEKLSSRSTAQGLVGIHIEGSVGTLVEVNCETDFVARNDQFRTLVSQVAKDCASTNPPDQQSALTKEFLSEEQLRSFVASDGKSLSDHLALAIGVIGENMNLPRAARMIAPDGIELVGYSHPSPPDKTALLGKFGALLAIKSPDMLSDVVRQLCVHVVGMNPLAVGNLSDPKASSADDETLLVHQEFLSDPSKTVGEVLQEENIEVVDFIRFECGEHKKDDE